MARHKKKNKGVGLMCLLTVCATLLLCAGGTDPGAGSDGETNPGTHAQPRAGRGRYPALCGGHHVP